MTLKTFNLDEKIYKEFSKHCKKEGISMSKKVEKFIKTEVDKIKSNNEFETFPKDLTEINSEDSHPLMKYC